MTTGSLPPRGIGGPSPRRGLRRVLAEGTAVAAALADLVLPATCAGCEQPSPDGLCPACRPALQRPARLAWPSPSPRGLPPPWAAAVYDGAVRGAIGAHKEHGRRTLAPVLAAALARSMAAALSGAAGDVLVVPVPSTRAARRRRGGDPLHRLVTLAVPPGLTCRRALEHRRRPVDQSGLGARARWDNLAGALVVPDSRVGGLAGARVLVVDDVLTTGATLAEAARALRCAGARVVGAAVVAATPRRVSADGARAPSSVPGD